MGIGRPRLIPREDDRGYKTPCLVWPGGRNENGYGRAWGGQAHRVAWERVKGPIPEGYELDHLCRQRDCVRVDHLEVVTHAENCRRGAAARPAVCDAPVSVWLRDARRGAGLSQAGLAGALGVSQSLVAWWESGKGAPTPDRLVQIMKVAPVPEMVP